MNLTRGYFLNLFDQPPPRFCHIGTSSLLNRYKSVSSLQAHLGTYSKVTSAFSAYFYLALCEEKLKAVLIVNNRANYAIAWKQYAIVGKLAISIFPSCQCKIKPNIVRKSENIQSVFTVTYPWLYNKFNINVFFLSHPIHFFVNQYL